MDRGDIKPQGLSQGCDEVLRMSGEQEGVGDKGAREREGSGLVGKIYKTQRNHNPPVSLSLSLSRPPVMCGQAELFICVSIDGVMLRGAELWEHP